MSRRSQRCAFIALTVALNLAILDLARLRLEAQGVTFERRAPSLDPARTIEHGSVDPWLWARGLWAERSPGLAIDLDPIAHGPHSSWLPYPSGAVFGAPACPCPPGAMLEAEACGEQLNDGCSAAFCGASGFEDIADGESYCGTMYAIRGHRDFDYYRFTVDVVSQVDITFAAAFPIAASIVEDISVDCAFYRPVAIAYASDCNPTILSRTLVAGDYAILLTPGDASGPVVDGLACDADNQYSVTLDFSPAASCPCPAGAVLETESCGASADDGCGSSPMAQAIGIGDTVCGTAFTAAVGASPDRDIDSYEFTVTDISDVTITLTSEFPTLFAMTTSDCPTPVTLATATNPGNCSTTALTRLLAPGTYWCVVQPGDEFGPISHGMPCTDPATDYSFTLGAQPAVPSCTLNCPAGAESELELCGDDTNSGCDAPSPAFEALTLGGDLCGTAWAEAGARDIDAYQFNVSAIADVELTLDSELPMTLVVLSGDCPDLIEVTEVHTSGCNPVSRTLTLVPALYRAMLIPESSPGVALSAGYPCGYQNRYTITSSIAPVTIGACPLPCLPGATTEPEPCGTELNNLCLASGPSGSGTIALGETICGQMFASTVRDFDFFEFDLDSPTRVTVELSAQVPTSVSISQDIGMCPSFDLPEEDLVFSPGDCQTVAATSGVLAAGTYLLTVTAGTLFTYPVFFGYPCSGNNTYNITLTDAALDDCIPPVGTVSPDCASAGAQVELIAGSCYDDVTLELIDTAGTVTASTTLPGPFAIGDPILWSPVAGAAGDYTVTVDANCCNGDTAATSFAITLDLYGGEDDIIFVGEDPFGCVDSVTALESALESAGHSVLIANDLANFTCADQLSAAQTVWVLRGTFPNNSELTAAEGERLVAFVTSGIPVYLEGGDIWGADGPTAFRDFDGVAGRSDDGVQMANGNDSFTSMMGALDPLIDTDAFGVVDYAQDNRSTLFLLFLGNDFTDQLLPSGDAIADEDLPAGSSAIPIWFNSDDTGSEPTYVTAIAYAPNDPVQARVISQSWEFGGFDGDRDALLATYLAFLHDTLGAFRRGDANGDGLFDISDAIYSLAALFTPGAPQPACEDASDSNDDGTFDISDAVFTLAALFTPGSPSPPAPGTSRCGPDPSDDALSCETYDSCL